MVNSVVSPKQLEHWHHAFKKTSLHIVGPNLFPVFRVLRKLLLVALNLVKNILSASVCTRGHYSVYSTYITAAS